MYTISHENFELDFVLNGLVSQLLNIIFTVSSLKIVHFHNLIFVCFWTG